MQTIVATSTMEAEFIACYKATTQALWLTNFVCSLKIVDSIVRPINVFVHNHATIFFFLRIIKVEVEVSVLTSSTFV
jgi:hypothetical protein